MCRIDTSAVVTPYRPLLVRGRQKQNISGTALRGARANVFGRESSHEVHFEAALLGRHDQHPATFFQILSTSSNNIRTST